MLCTIALRRTPSHTGVLFDLRITGKTALGPSGTGGQEIRSAQTADEVRLTLRQLGLGGQVLAAAEVVLADVRSTLHFTPIAEDVQIPFDVLDRAGIALFD